MTLSHPSRPPSTAHGSDPCEQSSNTCSAIMVPRQYAMTMKWNGSLWVYRLTCLCRSRLNVQYVDNGSFVECTASRNTVKNGIHAHVVSWPICGLSPNPSGRPMGHYTVYREVPRAPARRLVGCPTGRHGIPWYSASFKWERGGSHELPGYPVGSLRSSRGNSRDSMR